MPPKVAPDIYSDYAELELGNKYRLNPMDKERGLAVLEEVLFKYQGDAQILSPFIALLIKVAKRNFSPIVY
jgi:hypothetical protein